MATNNPTNENAELDCKHWSDEETPDELLQRTLTDFYAAVRSIENVPYAANRSEYEAACVSRGIVPLSDHECTDYGIQYGEHSPWLNGDKIENPPERCIELKLAARRGQGVIAERKAAQAARKIALPEPVMVKCTCGHMVEKSEVMSASLGTSCLNCYDRMSA